MGVEGREGRSILLLYEYSSSVVPSYQVRRNIGDKRLIEKAGWTPRPLGDGEYGDCGTL